MNDLSQDEVIHIKCPTSPIMKQGGNSLVRDPAATIHNRNINMTGSNNNVARITMMYNNGSIVNNYNSSEGNDDIVDTNQRTSHPNYQSGKHLNHQSGRDDQSMHVYREMGVLMLTMLLLLVIITNYTIFFIDLITNAGSCLLPTNNNGGNSNKYNGSEGMDTVCKHHDAHYMQHRNKCSAPSQTLPNEVQMQHKKKFTSAYQGVVNTNEEDQPSLSSMVCHPCKMHICPYVFIMIALAFMNMLMPE